MSQQLITINVRNVGKVSLVDLEGRLIMGRSVDELKREGTRLINSGTSNLGVNLAKLNYIDSSGIGALATLWTSAKRAGVRCRFYAVSPRLATIFKITRLDTALEFAPSEEAVLTDS